jgi:hypothetical protein
VLNCELLGARSAVVLRSWSHNAIGSSYWVMPCRCRDKWIEKVKRCEYLAEDELKSLCEYVSELQEGATMLFVCFFNHLSGCRSRRSLWRSLMYSQCTGLLQ